VSLFHRVPIFFGIAFAVTVVLAFLNWNRIANWFRSGKKLKPIHILQKIAFTTVFELAFLNWDRIIDWFRSRAKLKQAHRDNIAFTVKEDLDNGNYSVVQGIFNTGTEQVLDAVKYEAKDVCDELKYSEPLTIYN